MQYHRVWFLGGFGLKLGIAFYNVCLKMGMPCSMV